MDENSIAEVRKIINELVKGGRVIPKQQIFDLARNEGIPEEEVIDVLKRFIEEGTLVRHGENSFEVPV